MVFNSITDKIDYLIKHDYIETAFIQKYRPEFLEELYQFIKDQDFQFKSFMAAYKFYNQYALKTNDGEYYLESMEDRVFFNALYFADGDEAIAIDIANEIIHQRYQPATPSFLNAGRARRGELVSCFLIQLHEGCWVKSLHHHQYVKVEEAELIERPIEFISSVTWIKKQDTNSPRRARPALRKMV